MKKIYSLIKATMTSDMNIFNIKQKKDNKKNSMMLPMFISLCFMFSIWSNANMLFEKLAPLHLQFIVLSIFVFLTAIMTIGEGIYKAGPLIFNCRDDQLLLSLPIKKKTVLFVRIFKFYVFELLFNSLFIVPLIVAYLRWADTINVTFFLVSFVMFFTLPIIPIVISCIIGAITASVSSRFKFKNLAQIIVSMIFIMGILYLSFNLEGIISYLTKHATSVNDFITKIYYPAGMYAKLVSEFNLVDLLVYILVNITIFVILILILNKVYFKINSRLKQVSTTKKVNVKDLEFKSNSIIKSLIKKELNTFFKTPVFIINAGFGLVLFVIVALTATIKFDALLPILTDKNGINLSKNLILDNLSILVFLLIMFTSFMTSITNSVISLEGRNINILKSLPIKVKTILMSKIYSSLILTTPVLLLGDIILIIKFKIGVLDSILLIVLSILTPLISHFIGIIVNLKYPKLDAENSAEVVKQSTSSFMSVTIGMILLFVTAMIVFKILGAISATLILLIFTAVYLIIDIILYLYLLNKGIKDFNNLSI